MTGNEGHIGFVVETIKDFFQKRDSQPQEFSRVEVMLRDHRVMALATTGENGPYCTPVMYALGDGAKILLFMSKVSTLHCQHITRNPKVAASIFLDSENFSEMRGVQITGTILSLEEAREKELMELYFRTYPRARALRLINSKLRIYALKVETIKLIDNRSGFGSSFYWDLRSPQPLGVAPG